MSQARLPPGKCVPSSGNTGDTSKPKPDSARDVRGKTFEEGERARMPAENCAPGKPPAPPPPTVLPGGDTLVCGPGQGAVETAAALEWSQDVGAARLDIDAAERRMDLADAWIEHAFAIEELARSQPDDAKAAAEHKKLLEASKVSGGFGATLGIITDLVGLVLGFRGLVAAVRSLTSFVDVAGVAGTLGIEATKGAKTKATTDAIGVGTGVLGLVNGGKNLEGKLAQDKQAPTVDDLVAARLDRQASALAAAQKALSTHALFALLDLDLDVLGSLEGAQHKTGGVGQQLEVARACGRHLQADSKSKIEAGLGDIDAALARLADRFRTFSSLLTVLSKMVEGGDDKPIEFAKNVPGRAKVPGFRQLYQAIRERPEAYAGNLELVRAHRGYRVNLGPECELDRMTIDDRPASEGPSEEQAPATRARIPARMEKIATPETFHLRALTGHGAEVLRVMLPTRERADTTGLPEIELSLSEGAALVTAGITTSAAQREGAIFRPYVGGFTDMELSFGGYDGPTWWSHANLLRFVQSYPEKFLTRGGQSIPPGSSIDFEVHH